ncbi:peptidoglycan-binding protein [Streptomyces sp. NPDC005492]|uniref:peptidoglycan-binding protein n=1 Tax=Streptomyces sp. NPDC005492 TaxID=3156883 RepID=UPI0033A1C7A4
MGNLLDADSSEHFGTNPSPLPDIFALGWFDKNTRAPANREEIEEEYRQVKFSGTNLAPLGQKEQITRLRISDEDIDSLVTAKLDSFEATLKGRAPFTGFDDWPADGQLGLLSMAWAMGPLFNFPKFQGAAAQSDWTTMARECKMTEAGNPGVIPRNIRNALLFSLAGWTSSQGGADFSQLIYDPTQKLDANMRSGAFPVPLELAVGVQTALETLGFNPNGLDGIIGPGTRSALTSFQSSVGLSQTPDVGSVDDIPPDTVSALATGLDGKAVQHFP